MRFLHGISIIILLNVFAAQALAFPFVLPQVQYREAKGLRLNFVDQRPDLGIRYTVYRSSEHLDLVKMAYVFGTLNRHQFDFLKNAYGQGKSQIMYDASRIYELTDFLPPTIQAVLGHRFLVEPTKLKGREIECNCWGTAYEVVRGAPEIAVFWADEQSTLRFFFNDDYSEQVGAMPKMGEVPDLTGRLKSGDVFVYTLDNVLKHAAIYIDHNVFFEMVGTDSKYPYRLIAGFGSNTHLDYKNHKVDIRRFGGINKKSVPHPSEVLSYYGDPIAYRDYKLTFEATGDEAGRAFLPSEAYLRDARDAGKSIPKFVLETSSPVFNNCAQVAQGARQVLAGAR